MTSSLAPWEPDGKGIDHNDEASSRRLDTWHPYRYNPYRRNPLGLLASGSRCDSDSQDELYRALSSAAFSVRRISSVFGEVVFEPHAKDTQTRNEIISPYFDPHPGCHPLLYPLLHDPANQIRLLSRSSEDGWLLDVWDIMTAPPYAALSTLR